MRSALPMNAVLALLSLAGPAAAILPAMSDCVHAKSGALAELTSCGHQGSIAFCLTNLPSFFETTDLETCFVNAGCTPAEATIEALWTLKRCEHGVISDDDLAELRRRAPQAATTPTPTTPATTPKGATSIDCSTTNTISTTFCPTQTTGTASGARLSCFPTTILKTKCADGIWCTKKPGVCKVKNNTLDTSGVVVAIFFSVALIVAILSMCFMVFKDKKKQRGIRARAEAAEAAARERERKRPDVAVRDVSEGGVKAPLMQVYEEDPFRDQHRM
ncbi:hypothetical protein ACHAQH_004601 [Verticillium albo-atrum]